MDAREAYQRRAWRLALLLTDSDAAASKVLHDVTRLHPAPERSSDARYDRTVIQSARPVYESPEREPAADALPTIVHLAERPARLWDAARALDPQPREAWVLTVLDGLDTPRAARAMDCSRNALESIHLPAAQRHLEGALAGDRDAAERELIGALDTLDPSAAVGRLAEIQAAQRSRSRLMTAASLGALFVAFGLLLYVLVDLMRWQDDHGPVTIENALSNPLPEAAPDPAQDPAR